MLFLDSLLGRDRFSCSASCNAGKKELAEAGHSSLSGVVTLGYLQDQPILIICLLIVFSFFDYSKLVEIVDYNK